MDVPQYLNREQFEKLESIALQLSDKGRNSFREGDKISAKKRFAISYGIARYLELPDLISLNHDWLAMLCPTNKEVRSLEKQGYEKTLFLSNISERIANALLEN